jgi:hypothetical protein
MMNSRRNSPQALRFAARRKREDGAPRLQDEIVGLFGLELNVEDRAGAAPGARYTRRVVVERAPALFLVPCAEPRCTGEGHDLTPLVMRGLLSRETSFHGEQACVGSVGPVPCARTVHFDAVATYRPADTILRAPKTRRAPHRAVSARVVASS